VRQPAADAEVLVARALGVSRARLHAEPDRRVDAGAAARLRDLVARRARREPLQYVLGVQEFWSLEFRVTPAVLVPRPETELVLAAFVRLNRRPDPVVLDLGTGSGCIAVAAAREVPGARVVASDVSEEALEVARDNARRHGVEKRIEFRRGDLLGAFAGTTPGGSFDFILSNPPYVAAADLQGLEPEVRDHEPRAALVAGPDGLEAHRRIAADTPRWLRPGGCLVLEIGVGQEEAVRALYAGRPGLEVAGCDRDLAGIPRVCVVRSVAAP
jgi:release factor glutamine methyltransferase